VSQIKIGTRASKLAVAQAELVARRLRALGQEVELVKVTTSGDRLVGSLAEQGGKGLWVLELERGLLDGTIDLAVHSAKDLPVELMDGLTIGAYPEREDARDVFLGAPGRRFTSLPPGSKIGTGSQRRIAMLRAMRPELQPVPIRGNVPTRIAKIESMGLDGIIVAAAGLVRLGMEDHILDPLDPERYLPAGGQGALAIEVRIDDAEVQELVGKLDSPAVAAQVRAERAFLTELGADCHLPVAVHATLHGLRLRLRAMVLDPEGSERVEGSAEGESRAPDTLGFTLGRELLQRGARRLVESSARS
jgi:hydroxymethylbilane synthase